MRLIAICAFQEFSFLRMSDLACQKTLMTGAGMSEAHQRRVRQALFVRWGLKGERI